MNGTLNLIQSLSLNWKILRLERSWLLTNDWRLRSTPLRRCIRNDLKNENLQKLLVALSQRVLKRIPRLMFLFPTRQQAPDKSNFWDFKEYTPNFQRNVCRRLADLHQILAWTIFRDRGCKA